MTGVLSKSISLKKTLKRHTLPGRIYTEEKYNVTKTHRLN